MAKSTGVISELLIPFLSKVIVCFIEKVLVSITLTVPPSSLVTQYSSPFLAKAPLLGLFPTSTSSIISPIHGSIIMIVLVPSDVMNTSLPSGVKLTPSGSIPTSSITLIIFPV